MATIYHHYKPGDSTYVCPQNREISDDSPQVINTVRRLSEQSERRLSEQRRRSSVASEKTSVLGGLQSMREGKLPTNEHLNRIINRLLHSNTIETNKRSLSSDGQLLLKDFQELLVAFQHALQTKNRDELFQSMIYHVHKSEVALNQTTPDGRQVQSDMKTGAKSILAIAKLFLFNSQFRSILEQILTIAQQTMGGAIQEGGKMLHDNAGASANKISSYGNNDQADSAADRNIETSYQDNRLGNAALGASGGAALAGGAGYLGSNKDKYQSTKIEPNMLSSSDGLEHNPHADKAHIPVPEQHVDFLSHRFVEPEHTPTKDDAGNMVISENADPKSIGPLSEENEYTSDLKHHPHAGHPYLPVPDEHLGFLSHRFAEPEHGAPIVDDGGNNVLAEDFNSRPNLHTSESGISSRFLRQDNDFLHNRLNDSTPVFAPTNTTTTAAAEKVFLEPKTNIGVGAGYDLKESKHTVPADEVIDNLRRKPSASYAGAGLAGAGLAGASHADADTHHPTGHGQVKRRTSIFPDRFDDNIVNLLDQSTNTGNTDGQDAGMGQKGKTDSEHSGTDRMESSRGIGASNMGAAGAGALRSEHEQRRKNTQDGMLEDRFSRGTDGIKHTPANMADESMTHNSMDGKMDKGPADVLDNTTGYVQQDSIHPTASSNQQAFGNTAKHQQDTSGSGMRDINQSSHIKGHTAAMAASGVGLGAGAGAMMANRGNQMPNLQSPRDNRQSIENDQNRFTKDTPISANTVVNKSKKSAGISRFKEEGLDDQGSLENGDVSISADEIIRQLKEILTKIQNNPEYQQAISSLISLFGDWGQRLKSGAYNAMDRRRSSAVSTSEQKEYYANAASREAKTVIEDWAQGRSLDPLIQKGTDLASKLKEDNTLQRLYEKVMSYIQRLLQEPGYLADDQSTKDGEELVTQIRHSALEKYKPEVNSVIQESNTIIRAVSEDPNSKMISQKIKAIHNHLWYDRNGNASFKPQLLNDIRITLIPALIEQVKYVPLPQIVYSDKQYEIAIENMILAGDTLMPDVFEVKVDDFLRFSPNSNLSYTNSQSMSIHLMGIQTMMEDVVFYYKKKTGFPRLSDSGVVSIHTGGTGVKISMKLVSNSVDQTHTFRVDQCHCHIDKLNFNVQSSKHNTLYKVFNPVLTGIIKRQMAKTIENKIIALFENGDAKITKHLYGKQESGQLSSNDARRPGLFSHLVSMMSQKVSVI